MILPFWQSTLRKFFPRQELGQIEPQSRIVRDSYSTEVIPFNVMTLFQAYKRNSWIYSGINMLVSSCVAVPLKIRNRGSKEVISPTESEPVGAVLKYPNPHMTQFDLLERLFLHLEICGNAFWELVTDPGTRRLVAIYPLDPNCIEIKPDPRRLIAGYKYTVSGRETEFSRDDIVHLWPRSARVSVACLG